MTWTPGIRELAGIFFSLRFDIWHSTTFQGQVQRLSLKGIKNEENSDMISVVYVPLALPGISKNIFLSAPAPTKHGS